MLNRVYVVISHRLHIENTMNIYITCMLQHTYNCLSTFYLAIGRAYFSNANHLPALTLAVTIYFKGLGNDKIPLFVSVSLPNQNSSITLVVTSTSRVPLPAMTLPLYIEL